ncbi:hypothetical protein AOY86_25565 [Escherichia coli]|nr:hypothetical protein AOY86_25565 [Escherichia coli]
MRVYKFIRLRVSCWPCTRFCRLTESKFVVYDVIGRNMFLELLVVGFYRVFCSISLYCIESVFSSHLVYLISIVNAIR